MPASRSDYRSQFGQRVAKGEIYRPDGRPNDAQAIKCSAEGERQQAGTQQHEARCSQGQKSVGDQIVITHDTPALTRCSSELIKAFRTLTPGKR